ncbi:MAG: hypothetical protein HYZ37_07315 [Candidatus Solibacter usitatus]|nr:hypothetical protein [Candidatus Solibacter usitatus]
MRSFPALRHSLHVGRFDSAFKSLAESDPYALLEMFGGIDTTTILKLTPLERELNIPQRVVDQTYLVETVEGQSILHFESQLYGDSDLLLRTLRQDVAVWLKTGLPVHVTVIWLSKRHAPKNFPEWVDVKAGDLELRLHIRSVKAWELPAQSILRLERPSAWPWVSVADARREDVFQAYRRIEREVAGKEERNRLVGEFTVLAGLRYNRVEIDEVIGRADMVFSYELMDASSTVQSYVEPLKEKARQEGLKQGLEQGLKEAQAEKAGEARRLFRLVLEARFPDLANSDLIDKIADVPRVEEVFRIALRAEDEASMRVAMERAAS